MIIWASESVVDFQKYYLKKNQMWIFKNLVFIGAVCIKTFEKSVKKQQQWYHAIAWLSARRKKRTNVGGNRFKVAQRNVDQG